MPQARAHLLSVLASSDARWLPVAKPLVTAIADRLQFLEQIGVTRVERYEMQNIGGFNFVAKGILRRGLRNDAQGKALAQALLSMHMNE